jgi:DNA gyrase subunit A
LQVYIEHRKDVITRRSEYELEKARQRAHILDGLLIALANLDDVIETIRKSADADVAKERLMTRFKLSDVQAQAILDLQLRRLAALEREKIEQEHKEILKKIAYLEDLLAHPKKILGLIVDDLDELVETYGDDRRTRIAPDASEEFSEEDLVADEAVLISITQRGYIKRVAAKAYRRQARGGRADRTARGISILNVLALDHDEKITAAVPVPDFNAAAYCIMATRKGKIKRVELSHFESVRPSGLIAIGLARYDVLGWVRPTSGDNEIIVVTEKGKALRYHEKHVRPMGRPAAGVKAITLAKGDVVTSMDVVDPDGDLLVVSTKGYGKRTPLKEYTPKGRATQGVITLSKDKRRTTGVVASARVVTDEDDLTLISSGGIVMKTKVKQISQMGRAAMGVRVMDLKKGETVASVAISSAKELKLAGVDASEAEDNADEKSKPKKKKKSKKKK